MDMQSSGINNNMGTQDMEWNTITNEGIMYVCSQSLHEET